MLSQRFTLLTPYVPGEQPRDRTYIKLNTNENPYPPAPAITELLKNVNTADLRRYPDPQFCDLREAVARRYRVATDQIFVGNGSDEVLSFTFYAFFDSRCGPLLFPEHTYSFYPVYCDYYGIRYRKLPLADDFSVRLSDYVDNEPSSGIILPNPNAPTGIALPLNSICGLLDSYAADRVVVIDEAYVDFGAESALSLIDRYANLLIVRTCSKSMSLAGIRLGFALGNPELITALFTVKDSFNSYPVNSLTQQIGVQAMAAGDYYADITATIIRSRDAFSRDLAEIGWQVLPSAANFVFVRKPGVSGQTVYQTLKSRGILVRYFDMPGLKKWVRITIGTEAEMLQLVAAIEAGIE